MSNTMIKIPVALLPAIHAARQAVWAASEVSIADASEALVASEHAVTLIEPKWWTACANCDVCLPEDSHCPACGVYAPEGWVCPCGQLCGPLDGFCQACGFGSEEPTGCEVCGSNSCDQTCTPPILHGSYPTEDGWYPGEDGPEEEGEGDWDGPNEDVHSYSEAYPSVHEPRWACQNCGEAGISDLLSHCPICPV